ncbi:ABC transporter substrate-binding protein [Conexibacter sp. CPCC 206217]|uniref:ABC transporter substrate-binding protein n=1 Tax=Conexibacter sp. CPCC 206217 TaxID=3064574 RepID=UPI0027239EA9|nr:ABC transporter substrate-binding protein [Conexibacter sp. CPCC 206217]MDO8212667.1 ABC transporter substrate-binding protein [Conexibacter sp. CPCC 206217]
MPRSSAEDRQVLTLAQELRDGRIGRRQFIGRAMALGLGATSISAILAACGSSEDGGGGGGGAGGGSGAVRTGVANAIGKFDPHSWGGFTANIVTNHVYQGLVRLGFGGQRIEPALAASWENPDPRTWIYHLRRDVTFHDGTPFTADDVVFSTLRSKRISWGTYGWTSLESVRARDRHTVEVKLHQPDFRFQWAYYWPPGAIVSKAYFDRVGETAATSRPVGTNAFRFVRASSNQVVLDKYDGYWEDGLPYVDQVVLDVLDGSTIVSSLKTGDVTLSPDVDFDQLELVSGFGDVGVKAKVGPHIVTSYPNVTRAPFNDVNARKAVMEALDNRSALSAYPEQYYEPSAGALIHRSFEGSAYDQTNAMYTGDLARAKQYLEASATPDGFSVDWLVVATRPQEVSAVLGAAEQLGKIGIRVNIKQLPDGDVSAALYKRPRPFDIGTYNWLHNQPNTLDPLAGMLSSANLESGNFSGYSDRRFDRLVNDAVITTDDEQRNAKLRQLQLMAAEEAVLFPHGWDAMRRAESNSIRTPEQTILAEWDDWYRTSRWA